jgi:hypothetical protein
MRRLPRELGRQKIAPRRACQISCDQCDNSKLSATPLGLVDSTDALSSGCRYAQPRANVFDPAGIRFTILIPDPSVAQ